MTRNRQVFVRWKTSGAHIVRGEALMRQRGDEDVMDRGLARRLEVSGMVEAVPQEGVAARQVKRGAVPEDIPFVEFDRDRFNPYQFLDDMSPEEAADEFSELGDG